MTEFDGLPVLRSPVAIAAFEGWNDAADASTAAVEHLEQVWDARDGRRARPGGVLRLPGQPARRSPWPTARPAASSGRPPGSRWPRPPGAEHDVVLIRGIEPSMRWRTFCEEVLEVCHSLEVEPDRAARRAAGRRAVHPAAADQRQRRRHAPTTEQLELTPTRYEGPTGIVGVLHDACQPRRARRRVVLGARAALRQQPALPEGDPGPAAPGRGGPRPAGARWPTWPRSRPSGRSGSRAAAEQDAELAEYVRELEERAGDAASAAVRRRDRPAVREVPAPPRRPGRPQSANGAWTRQPRWSWPDG